MKNDLFKQLGLQKLSNEDKLRLSEDLGGVALERIAVRLEARLTPEQMDSFESLLQTDEAEAFTLLKEYVPDYQTIAREEIEQLQDEVINTHDSIMKKWDKLDKPE